VIGLAGFKGGADSAVVCLSHGEDPVFAEEVLKSLDFLFPGAKKAGAVAGGLETDPRALIFLPKVATSEDERALLEGQVARESGVVGLAISGDLAFEAIVAQGSRPIGPNFEVLETDFNGTVITRMQELGGSTAQGAPMTLFDMAGFSGQMEAEEIKRALDFLALGVSLTPLEDDPDEHQYIVRPITDLQKDGPLSLAGEVRPGQVVRFHVRDPDNARSELEDLMLRWRLARAARRTDGWVPGGALVFADAARGEKLLGGTREGAPFADAFPGVSLGGSFIDGAIGDLPNFRERKTQPTPLAGNVSAALSGVDLDQLMRGPYSMQHPLPTARNREPPAFFCLWGSIPRLLDVMACLSLSLAGTHIHTVGSTYLMVYGRAKE